MTSTTLNTIATVGSLLLWFTPGGLAQEPQQVKAAPTIASVMGRELGIIEQQLVAAAEAMPEEKYPYAPRIGDFDGVRTFAQEVKHVATINYAFYSALVGVAPPDGVTDNKEMNGPESIRTKDQIVKYLEDSFAFAHKAIATITSENATRVLEGSSTPRPGVPSFLNTRLALASFGSAHVFDHYGQIVEYLRMNGITPPASRGQPPANPQKQP